MGNTNKQFPHDKQIHLPKRQFQCNTGWPQVVAWGFQNNSIAWALLPRYTHTPLGNVLSKNYKGLTNLLNQCP